MRKLLEKEALLCILDAYRVQNLVYTSGYFIRSIQSAQSLKYQCLYAPDEPRLTIHMCNGDFGELCPRGYQLTTALGGLRKAFSKALLHRRDPCRPGQGVRPLANGRMLRDKVQHTEAGALILSSNAGDTGKDVSWALFITESQEASGYAHQLRITTPRQRDEQSTNIP